MGGVFVVPGPDPARRPTTLPGVPEDLSAAVAAEIRRRLEVQGWSGRELSRRTGISQRSVVDKLAGRTPFDLDDVQKVATALEVPVSALLPTVEN